MADPLDRLPRATVVPPKRTRISVIWIIPVLAAVVAIGIAIQRILSEGPTITIVFKAAEGIEAGKTFIKYKDVNIGQVTAVRLTDDYAKVEVTVKMAKSAAGLMVEDAKFWVVRPSVSLSGVSGLSTLLSGNYIGFKPGKANNRERNFIGLDVEPTIIDQLGRQFVINAADLGSLEVGSPIYFHRLRAGQVIAYELAADRKSVHLKIFIDSPYDKDVFAGTRFWNASGVDVSVGADGVKVRTESLVALLVGGLAFDTPRFEAQVDPAAAGASFALYDDRTTAMRSPDAIATHYVLYFKESLRGLSVGAPVTMLGLPGGEVSGVGLAFDQEKAVIRPRVTITLYPERLLAYAATKRQAGGVASTVRDEGKRRAFVRRLVEERGLRAQLKSGNLVTGQSYVALDFYPNAPRVKMDMNPEEPELPVVPGALADLETKLSNILGKIDKLPFEAIGTNIKKDLEELDQTLKGVNTLLSDVDVQVVPQLKTNLEDLHNALAAVERALNSADASLLGSDSPAQQELRDALQEFARAARSLRVLTDELERQPSSLIRGKPEATSGGK